MLEGGYVCLGGHVGGGFCVSRWTCWRGGGGSVCLGGLVGGGFCVSRWTCLRGGGVLCV